MPATISKIKKDSIAYELGLKKNDEIISINGEVIKDIIDFQYMIDDENIEVLVKKKNGSFEEFDIEKDFGEHLGVEFKDVIFDRLKTCGANCIFCFERQLPKNMRKSLVLKDDDYRLSFLYGCYITMGNLKKADFERIITQRLSPLYVSVHTVDDVLREKIIGKKTNSILSDIKYLCDNGIKIHTQIVLCPGINDGAYLMESINKLSEMYPMVESLALVPVGLTKHRDNLPYIKQYDKELSKKLIDIISQKSDELYNKLGTRFVWLADEFYIKAEIQVPDNDYYEDYLQIENGIGLVRDFLCDAQKSKQKFQNIQLSSKINLTLITGKSFYSILRDYFSDTTNENININLYEIKNILFGESVTVTGLICGKDIIDQLKDQDLGDLLIIPSVCLSDEGIFLDDITIKSMEDILGVEIVVVKPYISELIKVIKKRYKSIMIR